MIITKKITINLIIKRAVILRLISNCNKKKKNIKNKLILTLIMNHHLKASSHKKFNLFNHLIRSSKIKKYISNQLRNKNKLLIMINLIISSMNNKQRINS